MIFALLTKAKTDPKLWLFLFTFSQIQLAEFFIWNNLNSVIASVFALIIILLEPVMSINLIKENNFKNKLLLLYTFGVIIALLTTRITFKNKVGPNGHLDWLWIDNFNPLFALLWIFALLFPIWYTGYSNGFIFALVTMLTSMYFYHRYKTFSTMWCWISVFVWLFLFFKQ